MSTNTASAMPVWGEMAGGNASTLLDGRLEVVHAGIDAVAEAPRATGAAVTLVDFEPPSGGDPRRMTLLSEVLSGAKAPEIDAANARALARLLASRPHLVGIGIARDVIPGMTEDLFLHAGPPVTWERMCGPMRGAVIGGLLHEGRAKNVDEATTLAADGAVRFDPCHHHDAVGPMAGLVTPSMPVFIVEDRGGDRAGSRTFCTLNEGSARSFATGRSRRRSLRASTSCATNWLPSWPPPSRSAARSTSNT